MYLWSVRANKVQTPVVRPQVITLNGMVQKAHQWKAYGIRAYKKVSSMKGLWPFEKWQKYGLGPP